MRMGNANIKAKITKIISNLIYRAPFDISRVRIFCMTGMD